MAVAPDYKKLEELMLGKLRTELPEWLSYHSPAHTMDVLRVCERIAESENVSDDGLLLLKTAALLHDSGFTSNHLDHEEKSCAIAREMLPGFGYDDESIKSICEIIMATKIPQSPTNLLSEILCDADLDYLGRDDFFPIAEKLFNELHHMKVVKDASEWNQVQIRFFNSHHYFTSSSKKLRTEKKMKNLEAIKAML